MNLRDAEVAADEEMPPGFAFAGSSARERTGDELIGAGLYELPPGNQLWPYHFHVGNEEWAIVVSGTPTLRAPGGERELRAGDVVGFPQGEDGAHTFYNRGSGPSRIVIFSTLRSGYPTYPDSDKVAAGGRVFRRGEAVDYWEGEESGA
ncbi:MAG TPA: cupin domain-containing protein [Gaiellaceae bacterium]|nr:cupin domain-containing protein [Gaiellaceae bacterium]